MQCTKCGQELLPNAKFCPNCGTPVVVEHKCPSCGTVNPPQAKFCVDCGKSLAAAAPMPQAEAVTPTYVAPKPQAEAKSAPVVEEVKPQAKQVLSPVVEELSPEVEEPLTPTYEPTNEVEAKPFKEIALSVAPELVPEFDYSKYNLVVDENGNRIKYKNKVPKTLALIASFLFLGVFTGILFTSLVVAIGELNAYGFSIDSFDIMMFSIFGGFMIMNIITIICESLMYKSKNANKAMLFFAMLSPANVFAFAAGLVNFRWRERPEVADKKLYKRQLAEFEAAYKQYNAACKKYNADFKKYRVDNFKEGVLLASQGAVKPLDPIPEINYLKYDLVVDGEGNNIKYKNKKYELISRISSAVFIIAAIAVMLSVVIPAISDGLDYVYQMITIMSTIVFALFNAITVNFATGMLESKSKCVAVMIFSWLCPLNVVAFYCALQCKKQLNRPVIVNQARYNRQLAEYDVERLEVGLEKSMADICELRELNAKAASTAGGTAGVSSSGEATVNSTVGKYKPSKLSLIVFCVVGAYYLFLLIMGILGMTTNTGVLFSCEDEDIRKAVNYVVGYVVIAMVPTFGIYFAMMAPFDLDTKIRLIVAAASIGVMIILDIVFFTVKAQYAELLEYTGLLFLGEELVESGANDNVMTTVALFLSQIGILGVYGLRFIYVPEERLESRRYQDRGITGYKYFLDRGKHAFMEFGKVIMRFKQKHFGMFVGIGTFLFTLGIFIAASILIVVMVFLVIIAFIFVCLYFYEQGNTGRHIYTIIDGGSEYELRHYAYDYMSGGEVYKDQNDRLWVTFDNGTSFSLK